MTGGLQLAQTTLSIGKPDTDGISCKEGSWTRWPLEVKDLTPRTPRKAGGDLGLRSLFQLNSIQLNEEYNHDICVSDRRTH